MKVTIYTPKTKLIDNIESKAVYLPGSKGDMEILNNHIPLLTSLKKGVIKIETLGEQIQVALEAGYAQYSDNQMTIVIEQIHITDEEIAQIQSKAKKQKDKTYQNDEITQKEFEQFEDSERRVK